MVTSAHNHHVARIMALDGPAERLDQPGTAGAQGDEQDLIAVQVDDVVQATPQSYQVGCTQSTKKHRELPAEAEVLAGAGDLAESLRVGDVVGDEPGLH